MRTSIFADHGRGPDLSGGGAIFGAPTGPPGRKRTAIRKNRVRAKGGAPSGRAGAKASAQIYRPRGVARRGSAASANAFRAADVGNFSKIHRWAILAKFIASHSVQFETSMDRAVRRLYKFDAIFEDDKPLGEPCGISI